MNNNIIVQIEKGMLHWIFWPDATATSDGTGHCISVKEHCIRSVATVGQR